MSEPWQWSDMLFIVSYFDIVRRPFVSLRATAEWVEEWNEHDATRACWSGFEDLLSQEGVVTEISYWRRRCE